MKNYRDHYKDVLLGVAVGDAVGVPYEFKSREQITAKPAVDMIGYGTYGQPAGTWSDDSSLTFCLADALAGGFDLRVIGKNFVSWRYENLWTARGEVFDIGITTQNAINRLATGIQPDLAGDYDVFSNGNGSLMRILPLLFYIKDKPVQERYDTVRKVSSITHGHVRSSIACFYYLEFASRLLHNSNLTDVYEDTALEVATFLKQTTIIDDEIAIFNRLLNGKIYQLPRDEIKSRGYVLDTLEASIWCLMNTSNYKDAVLTAVNLGNDTDTTAAVTGGLAGLLYGYESIPEDWLLKLARTNDIIDLAGRMKNKFE